MTDPGHLGDFGSCHAWPEGFSDHLDLYRQGSIIDDVPVFFLTAGDRELWSQQRQQMTDGPLEIVGERGWTLRSAMLLTQACDLMKRKNPWVTVAPVYDASERLPASQHAGIRAGQILHLVHLTAGWAAEGLWVADLRLEMPVEKTALLDRSPRDAFSGETDYARLARRLGAQRARPAAPDSCIEHVIKPLFAAMRATDDGGASLNTGVREIRLQWNDPTAPTGVVIFVIVEDGFNRSDIAEGAWRNLIDSIYLAASQHGLTIVGPEITDLWDMSARDYVTSALIEDTEST